MSRRVEERFLVKVSEVFWPSVFEPTVFAGTARFGVSFRLEELPIDLHKYAKTSQTPDGDFVRIDSLYKPILFCLGDDLRLIPYHNSQGMIWDRVLTGIPLDLSIVSVGANIRHPTIEDAPVVVQRRLMLSGIRVWERDVVRRAEELMGELFPEDESCSST